MYGDVCVGVCRSVLSRLMPLRVQLGGSSPGSFGVVMSTAGQLSITPSKIHTRTHTKKNPLHEKWWERAGEGASWWQRRSLQSEHVAVGKKYGMGAACLTKCLPNYFLWYSRSGLKVKWESIVVISKKSKYLWKYSTSFFAKRDDFLAKKFLERKGGDFFFLTKSLLSKNDWYCFRKVMVWNLDLWHLNCFVL